tara:strand:- start:99 stop:323 length:225 start_codon:yes stop_codon:yes gene_type:complete
MSSQPNKQIPLGLLNENQIDMAIRTIAPSFISVDKNFKRIVLKFEKIKFILPLTNTITFGDLISSLKEKGLIND